jgi:hypothetical protein
MLVRRWSNRNSHSPTAKWCSHFGNQMAISYTTNHPEAIHPAVMFLGIYSKEMKTHSHIKPAHSVSISFIHSHEPLDATKVPTDSAP